MRRLFGFLVLLVLVGVGLYYWKYRPTGTSPQQALGSLGQRFRGAKTTGEIKAALELNRNLKPYPIDVNATGDGVVALKGAVPREDFKVEAGRVAAAVPGVREVHNAIRIDPALPPPAEGGRTLGENFDDKALEAKVKLAFSLNKGLDGTHLSVRAYRREVTVGGTVETPEQHQLALKLTGETSDVLKVHDEIQLRASGRVKAAAEKDLAGLGARDATGPPIDNTLEVRR